MGRFVLLRCFPKLCIESLGVEPKGAGGGLEGYSAVATDQIEAVGPTGVGGFSAVIEVVDQGRNGEVQVADAGTRYAVALVEISRGGEDHVLRDVGGHLPDVGGVGFEDVHDVEGCAVPVGLIELVERGSLPAKGRSRVE